VRFERSRDTCDEYPERVSPRERLLAAFDRTPDDGPIVIGHRGAPGYRPEHTRSSYLLAIESGVDAVEPDVVVSRDGVLVVRHDAEIGETTDVATRPEFADRRTRRVIDGIELDGWFTDDFTWAELATLRCRERIPALREASARFDGAEPMLRLPDLLALVAAASDRVGREVGIVIEVKHAAHFAARGWDLAALVARDLAAAGFSGPVVIESFEQGVLTALQQRGVAASYVYLVEAEGAAADLIAADGEDAATYASQLTPDGLDALAGQVDGISVDKALLLDPARRRVVADAHARGLAVFTWTARPENAFLSERFRRGGGDAAFGDWRGEWREIWGSGVDGVFVDHAELGVGFARG
jgi:glycerophosphoryl diester phosphodiesterase